MRLFFTAFTLAALAAVCSAQWTATAMSEYYTQYILVNGQNGYGKPVQQTDLTINHGGGAYFGGWLSLPYDGSDSYAKEVDLTVGYTGHNWDVGISYFLIKPIARSQGDAWYPYIKACVLNVSALRADLWAELDYVGFMDNPSSNGFLTQVYTKYTWCIVGTKLRHKGKVGMMHDGGIGGRNSSLLGLYQGYLQWDLGRGIALRAPDVKAFVPLSGSDIESDVAVGVGLTSNFSLGRGQR